MSGLESAMQLAEQTNETAWMLTLKTEPEGPGWIVVAKTAENARWVASINACKTPAARKSNQANVWLDAELTDCDPLRRWTPEDE